MASPNLAKTPEFLVFPTGSQDFAWKIVAVPTGRTLSRYRHLVHAVERAEELNLRAQSPEVAMPDPQFAQAAIFHTASPLGTCQHWYDWPQGTANECDRAALVTDLETGCGFCARHFQEAIL